MKIEIQIGCELDGVDIARNILENVDAIAQKVVPMTRVAIRDAANFLHRLEAWLKIESDYEAKISNIYNRSTFHWFDVDYRCKRSVVSVIESICSFSPNEGFDVVHLYGCEIFFDGGCGVSSDEFMQLCSGAKKVVVYFSEPYIATSECVEMLQGVKNKCDVSYVYHPRMRKVGEIDGNFGVCEKCSHQVFVDRPEELCSEVHLKIMDGEKFRRKRIGEDVRCITCARKYRVDDGWWRLAVNKRCPYYAEHFVSEANNGM